MTASTNKRLYALAVAIILMIGYATNRDSVRNYSNLSPKEIKPIVQGAVEWSSPKFFRHIEVHPAQDGAMAAWIQEPEGRWSVTAFTNYQGEWKKAGWFLLKKAASIPEK